MCSLPDRLCLIFRIYACSSWIILVLILAGCVENSISGTTAPAIERSGDIGQNLVRTNEKDDSSFTVLTTEEGSEEKEKPDLGRNPEEYAKLSLKSRREISNVPIEGSGISKDQKETAYNSNLESRRVLPDSNSLNRESSLEPEKTIQSDQANLVLDSLEEDDSRPIRVAILLPLSGSSADIGGAMLNAAMMAVFDIADDRFQLMPRDTQGSPRGASEAVNRVVTEGAEIILGPIFSDSVEAVAKIARPLGISIVAFSNNRSVAGNGVYLLGFMPAQQVQRVVEYARTQGMSRFAALLPETAYGDEVLGTVENIIPDTGGTLTKIETYKTETEDFRPLVKLVSDYERRRKALAENRLRLEEQGDIIAQHALERLKNQDTIGDVGFDAILLPEGGARLRSIAPLLAFYDVDPTLVKLLGTGLWDEPNLGLEPTLVGGWFAGPPPDVGASFRSRYREIFGKPPPRLASLAYDATALAAVLARQRTRPDYSHEALTNVSGFTGVDGLFRFGPNGIAERGLAILEVRRGGFKIVSPAPSVFD